MRHLKLPVNLIVGLFMLVTALVALTLTRFDNWFNRRPPQARPTATTMPSGPYQTLSRGERRRIAKNAATLISTGKMPR